MRLEGLLALIALVYLMPEALAQKSYTPGQPEGLSFENFGSGFLDSYCLDCHDDATEKGNLSLENLGPIDEANAALWKSVWTQVALKEMPPKKKEQPGVIERIQFEDWVLAELQASMKEKGGFLAHLDPSKANYVDHDLLFGELPEGLALLPASSPARIWRVSPQEHITRLNELINTEPSYNPDKPGLRARGDEVPTNHGGELKLYFGTDRIIRHQGGTVAYATAVKSIPVVLSSSRKHGFENYADFHTVNSAEATQILNKAEDILRYMAYGPLSLANPEQITDDPNTYQMKGDIRGLPTSLVYSTQVVRPITPLFHLMEQDVFSDEQLRAAVDFLFEALTFRPPTKEESSNYLAIVKETIAKVGKKEGVFMGLSSIFLNQDALFRPELAEDGDVNSHGREMLKDWELGLAVNHALTYLQPDDMLREAIVEGRMTTKEDVSREVNRMLKDDSIRKPRILRFFREFFDHDLGGSICKDTKALSETGAPGGNAHYRAMFDATASTDRMIELVLQEDQEVLRELLTSRNIVATRVDRTYYGRKRTREEVRVAQQKLKEENTRSLQAAEQRVVELVREVSMLQKEQKNAPKDRKDSKKLALRQKELSDAKRRLQSVKKSSSRGGNLTVAEANLQGQNIFARVSRKSFGNGSMRPERILAQAPQGERMGVLTQPSWLVSHSDAMDNHAIHRGRWIRERLLGGGIPDVPITVDAMLPDEPGKTLRERMRVTRETYCWTCHQKMDPLGLPFEMYNHAGIFRTFEFDQPVDTSGEILNSGDPSLDGPVENALEMIEKLSRSERVEQVFVRHAFRYWMGRNETLHDAPVLKAAHRAYRQSGGSMNALIASLLTSDAFLYRRRP